MKKINLICLFICLGFSIGNAQTYRAAVRQNGKWGFIDGNGNLVISANFDNVFDFGGGGARIKTNGRWGYINKDGNVLSISPTIDVWRDFAEGYASVRDKKKKWGFIDQAGQYAIPPNYGYAKEFSEGLGIVKVGGNWGFVGTNGKLVIDPKFSDVRPFHSNVALVKDRNGWGYINREGRKIQTPPVSVYKDFSDGLARVSNGRWGYIDTNGQWAIEPAYDEAFDFNDGVAVVRNGSKWMIINENGDEIGIPESTGGLKEFSNGLAPVESNGFWGYINSQGKWAIQPRFKVAKSFNYGYARIRDVNSKWGFIDTQGNWVVEPKFEDAKDFVLISTGGEVISYQPTVNKTQVGFNNSSTNTTIELPSKPNTPPTINITSPNTTRGFKVVKKTSTVRVAGKITDEDGVKSVFINNVQIVTGLNGDFMIDYPLLEGQNKLKVIATDSKNLSAEQIIYVEKAKTISQPTVNTSTLGGTYYALIIGIDEYLSDGVKDLDNPVKDARGLSNLLANNYTFSRSNITLLENPTRDEVFNELERHTDLVNENDNFLIFYAGHGYWDTDFKKGYWLCSDSEQNRRGSWFSNNDLYDYISGIKSKHTLLISDACFSGSIFKTRDPFSNAGVDIKKLNSLPSRKAMTSGSLKTVPDKSVFMEYLMKRLAENNNQYLSSESLFISLKKPVLLNSPNVPQFGEIHNTGGEGGDFIFIKK